MIALDNTFSEIWWLTASGSNDVITVNHTGAAGHTETITANGAGASVTLAHTSGTLSSSNNKFVITANGIGATVDTTGFTLYGTAASTISATGANDTLKLGSGLSGQLVTATLGQNATVTLGADGAGANYVDLNVASATAGDVSSGSYTLTTIKGTVGTADTVTFGTETHNLVNSGHAINVAGATSLAAALDMAATGSSLTASQGYLAWFQYAGDTYIVENIAEATSTTGIDANDVVVKLVGLHDLSSSTFATNAYALA